MTDAERAARLECQLWSALHHIRQVIVDQRDIREVAWWLRANHPEYMANASEGVRAKLNELADDAERMCLDQK